MSIKRPDLLNYEVPILGDQSVEAGAYLNR